VSRIGNNPIVIPDGVNIKIDNIEDKVNVTVTGKLGMLTHTLNSGITIEESDKMLKIKRRDDSKDQKSLHGLSRALVFNMINGVSKGYEKRLHVIGTGYSAEVKGPWLKLVLGFSHDILIEIPEHLKVETEAVPRSRGQKLDVQSIIKVNGISKEEVGSFAAEIRHCRPPENYKGKGIRYSDEIVHLKAGKTGA